MLFRSMEVPSSAWREGRFDRAKALKDAPLALDWSPVPGTVRHVFSHFALELSIVTGTASAKEARKLTAPYAWRSIAKLADEALPSAMTKVVAAVLGGTATPKPRGPSRKPSGRSR